MTTATHNTTSLATTTQAGLHYFSPLAANAQQHQLNRLLQQHQTSSGWTLILAPETSSLKALAELQYQQQSRVLVIHRKQIQDLAQTLKKAILAGTCSCIINFAELRDLQQSTELAELAQCCGCQVYCFANPASHCH
ncbi:hypothetical protein Q3O59_07260 [Alkalimonas delamerensis]|uniref:Cell division inhibitor SulA n=1 Tax=Alkalimonas delamerensis TaxID=265981 RepID=A0ABT9GPC5_9GAMM|nr:hypothetical protein [Alkalimonas delamerensis]MDP4528831.1 hypothetical protein [Alkalimonas delamerensis]